MPFTSQLGPESQLGSILLGQLDINGRFPSKVHFLDARTVRFVFPLPVTAESALLAAAYPVELVSAPGSFYVPTAESVVFHEAERTSVEVTYDRSFTAGATYGFKAVGIESDGGLLADEARVDSIASVTDPPRAVGAYLAGLQRIDVVFDRPVGPTTFSHSGLLTDGTSTSPLSGDSWAPPMPDNVLRFIFSASPSAEELFVDYSGVVDGSQNPGSGRIALHLPLRSPRPHNFARLNTAQIVDAYVDYAVPALGYAYLNVHFAHAMLPGIESLGYWQVTRAGAHVGDDSLNVAAASPAVDVPTLVVLAGALQGGFNSHLARQGIHAGGPVPASSEGAAIAAVNDLSRMLDRHVLDAQAHSSADSPSASYLPPARTIAQADSNLRTLVSRFVQHRSSTVHSVADSAYDFLGTYPSGDNGAGVVATWADDLRWKLRLHSLTQAYHPTVVPSTPEVPPCSPYVESQSPAYDLVQAVLVVNEMSEKYAMHAASDRVHSYFDDVNAAGPFAATDDVNSCVAQANALLSAFNAHLAVEYPAGLQQVVPFVSDPGFPPDGMNHFARLRISSTSPAPVTVKIAYGAQFQFVGNPGSDTTSASDYTGKIVARSVREPARRLSFHTDRRSHSAVFDRQVQVRSFDVALSGRPVPSSVSYSASLRTLATYVSSLADRHTAHLAAPPVGSGHSTQDVANPIPPNQYPSYDLASVLTAVNYVRQAFNAHVSGGFHASDVSDRSVMAPSATDMRSCERLARALADAMDAHLEDGSAHSSPGLRVDLSKPSDVVTFRLGGVLDGGSYVARGEGSCLVQLRDGTRSEVGTLFSSPFVGRESPPHLASAVAESGLRVRFPSGFPTLGPDVVKFYFSRPMELDAVDSGTQVSVSGPPGSEVGDPYWISPRVMVAEVRHLASGSYTVGVSGVRDAHGNAVAP